MKKIRIIDCVPFGREHAVSRTYLSKMTGLSDRKVRDMIHEECTEEHPILNLQDGHGYFRPQRGEDCLVERAIRQEEHRMSGNKKRVMAMKRYLKRCKRKTEDNQMNIFDFISDSSGREQDGLCIEDTEKAGQPE